MSRAKGDSPHWFLVNSGVTVEEFCGWSTDEFCRNFLLQLPIRPLSVLEASAKNVRAFQVPAAAFLRATHYDDFEQLGLDKWHIRFKVWIELERMLEVRYAEHTDVASHEFASLSWRHWQAIGQFPWQKHKGVRDYRGDYEAKEQEKLRVAALKEMAEMQAKEKRRKEALAKSEAAARLKLEAEAKRREDADASAEEVSNASGVALLLSESKSSETDSDSESETSSYKSEWDVEELAADTALVLSTLSVSQQRAALRFLQNLRRCDTAESLVSETADSVYTGDSSDERSTDESSDSQEKTHVRCETGVLSLPKDNNDWI